MALRSMAAIGAALLLASAPAIAGEDKEPAKVMPNGDPIICKKTLDTGSLVKSTKRCYTRAQWDRIAQAGRANATRMTSDHATGITTN